jgi:transcriptional regulator with XRE-family HTH domain
VTAHRSAHSEADAARRALGQRLARARKAAGYTQQQLAEATRYARSTIANAESGHSEVARPFWARCDRVLTPIRSFATAFDEFHAVDHAPVLGPETGLGAFGHARRLIRSGKLPGALTGYRRLGWPVTEGYARRADLMTGEVVDALEVPAKTGRIAASWWRYSHVRPDPARDLPALPSPARALAVIAAGDRWYFLAAAGGCAWTSDDGAPMPDAADSGNDAEPVICWHAHGSQIPVPPSPLADGHLAVWTHLPTQPPQLAPTSGILGLLDAAIPGGVRVVPAVDTDQTPPPAG